VVDFWKTTILLPFSSFIDVIALTTNSYGVAIIIVAILSKAVFIPLAVLQFKNGLISNEIKPLLKRIDTQFDMEKLTKEQLRERRLKRREVLTNSGVRPITLGCLPLVIQVPVMITVYQSISNHLHIFQSSFLWFHLSSPDHTHVLTLLTGLCCFVQTFITNPKSMKLCVGLSIIITAVAFILPAAIAVYLITINVYSALLHICLNTFLKKGDIDTKTIMTNNL
jgi:YidC/Oxa1 family membrane protein insertase